MLTISLRQATSAYFTLFTSRATRMCGLQRRGKHFTMEADERLDERR
jgi:hypothetical protein